MRTLLCINANDVLYVVDRTEQMTADSPTAAPILSCANRELYDDLIDTAAPTILVKNGPTMLLFGLNRLVRCAEAQKEKNTVNGRGLRQGRLH
jgi:hypothetical protein